MDMLAGPMKPTERELIAARDHDAMARFYDRHAAMVGEFCGAVCPDERVDEAVAAVFVNFLGRVTEGQTDEEPEELLRRAAREIAASRMEVGGVFADEREDPVCRAMPELLAARVNGELHGQAGPLAEQLAGCPTCQAAAARLGQAEVMFPVGQPVGRPSSLLSGCSWPGKPARRMRNLGAAIWLTRRAAVSSRRNLGPTIWLTRRPT